MRKLFSYIMIVFLIFSIHINASAFQTTDNQTVDSDKTWTIKFTDEVGFDDLTKSGITITDSKGTPVNVGIQLEQDKKTVTVTAPEGGYIPGENYTLNIGTKAHSSKGKSLKQERAVYFNIKSTNNIVKIKTYSTTVYQGKNYALPETVVAVFQDETTKELPVKWDHPYIDGSSVGDFTYYGTVYGCDKKAQVNITIKVMKDIYDLEDYLNKSFSSIDSPIGKLTFKYTVEENDYNLNPYDIRIKTEWYGIEPYDLEYSVKISSGDKEKTIDLLKQHQKKIADDALIYFPNKKIEGGFFTDGFKYPNIHEGYWSTTFLTWINYDYDLLNASDYKNTHVTNFQWFNLYDDYNFTGEPKRTR